MVLSPGGVMIGKHLSFPGTPAVTARGCLASDVDTIADHLLRAAQITCAVQRAFLRCLQSDNREILDLRTRAEAFCESVFPAWF